MKIRNSRSRDGSGGFTLIELLVVISLIAVLAALVLAGAGGIMKKVKRDQIRNFLTEIGGGLEDYKIDNAIYPLNPDPRGGGVTSIPGYSGPDSDAVAGSAVLYQHLSGDFNLDEQVDENETVYVERLDYWSNKAGDDGKAKEIVRSVDLGNSTFIVVDPLGSPLRYLADPPAYTPEERNTKNPTYDLWSVAGASTDSPDFSDQSKWITNWGSN